MHQVFWLYYYELLFTGIRAPGLGFSPKNDSSSQNVHHALDDTAHVNLKINTLITKLSILLMRILSFFSFTEVDVQKTPTHHDFFLDDYYLKKCHYYQNYMYLLWCYTIFSIIKILCDTYMHLLGAQKCI